MWSLNLNCVNEFRLGSRKDDSISETLTSLIKSRKVTIVTMEIFFHKWWTLPLLITLLVFLTTTANHENPELIWNDDARIKVSKMAKEMKDRWNFFFLSDTSFIPILNVCFLKNQLIWSFHIRYSGWLFTGVYWIIAVNTVAVNIENSLIHQQCLYLSLLLSKLWCYNYLS